MLVWCLKYVKDSFLKFLIIGKLEVSFQEDKIIILLSFTSDEAVDDVLVSLLLMEQVINDSVSIIHRHTYPERRSL